MKETNECTQYVQSSGDSDSYIFKNTKFAFMLPYKKCSFLCEEEGCFPWCGYFKEAHLPCLVFHNEDTESKKTRIITTKNMYK
jgi:hypothetical protein